MGKNGGLVTGIGESITMIDYDDLCPLEKTMLLSYALSLFTSLGYRISIDKGVKI